MHGDITVVRWRRYGKDRLYVNRADGTRLGWHDLVSGDTHAEQPEWFPGVESAVAEWLAANGGCSQGSRELGPQSGVVPEQRLPEVIDEDSEGDAADAVDRVDGVDGVDAWQDLAGRAAGAMARERAKALKDAAPVRTFAARLLGVHTDERAWRIGADGEEKVAARLSKLAKKDGRWRFLHAVPVGEKGSDIDHFVVGPGGVFTLNAKHHPGGRIWVGGNAVIVNGHRQPYVRNSRHEATRASRLLSEACGFPVFVTGVVVPIGADSLTVRSQPDGVHVVNRMALVAWLRARPQVLDDSAIAAVFDVARRSTTWRL